MAVSQTFRVQRLAVSAGVLKEVKPPAVFKAVSVGNISGGALEVHTNDDQSEYLSIADGYERLVPVDMYLFDPNRTAFWLKGIASGTVIVVWT